MKESVNVWEEDILLPTYGIGRPEKNPMFLEKRVYQGSSGVVYPYPVIEKIEDTCEEKSYHAVWLENEYIKVMILPELGGRIQMAFDKVKQRHFISPVPGSPEALSSTGLNITVPAPSCRWTTASNDVKTEVSLYG